MDKKNMIVMVLGVLFLSIAMAFNPTSGMGAEKYVTFLGLDDLTGPIAAQATTGALAREHFFREANEKGGVEGVKVKNIIVDCRYDTARAISAYNRYRKENKFLYVYVPSTGIAKVMYPYAERDKIVMQVPGVGEFQARLGRAFTYSPPYQDMFAASLDWAVEDWQKRGNPGKPVVGYIAWDNPFGKEHLLGGKEYVEKIGVKLLPPEFFPVGSLRHDVWLTRLAGQGVNYIFVAATDPEVSNVVRDAYALGLTKKIQFISDIWGTTMETGVKAHPDELEGEVIVSSYLRGDDGANHPRASTWKRYTNTPPSIITSYAGGYGMFCVPLLGALRIALKDVGYEKLDGDAFYQALLKTTGLNTEGITGPIDLSPTSRRVSRHVKFYRVTGGKIVPITDWRLCPDTVSMHKW